MALDEATKNNIVQRIKDKGAILPCQRCGKDHFVLMDGYTVIQLTDDIKNLTLGGTGIPSVILLCTHCGNLNFHALGTLGLLKT